MLNYGFHITLCSKIPFASSEKTIQTETTRKILRLEELRYSTAMLFNNLVNFTWCLQQTPKLLLDFFFRKTKCKCKYISVKIEL